VTRTLIIFSHGNSFPASTYGVMLRSLRGRGFETQAIERFGHNPRYPVSSNWPHLVDELAAFVGEQSQRCGQGAFLVGHSLGGFLSLMCAARHPQPGGHPIRGVVMLDAPILGGWKAAALSVAKRARLVGSISPGAVSRKRKQSWASLQEVQSHFASKKLFAPWDPAVLQDYIIQGTRLADPDGDADGPRVLSFDRDIEPHFIAPAKAICESLLARVHRYCFAIDRVFFNSRFKCHIGQSRYANGRVIQSWRFAVSRDRNPNFVWDLCRQLVKGKG
jgi:pimeloyl-ACP methyl ester carboxylesterase